MKELTKDQIDRQDFVDGKIHQLLNDIFPVLYVEENDNAYHPKDVKWDIEIIGEVRDLLFSIYQEHTRTMLYQAFYPNIGGTHD